MCVCACVDVYMFVCVVLMQLNTDGEKRVIQGDTNSRSERMVGGGVAEYNREN